MRVYTDEAMEGAEDEAMGKTVPLNWVARLRQFVTRPAQERCDFCSAAIPPGHAHLVEISTRHLHCACAGCAYSLGCSERFRMISPHTEILRDFRLNDSDWNALQIPIGMAFIYLSSHSRGPLAVYPSPAGATECELDPYAWSRLIDNNPQIADLRPDVEALLVNRTHGDRDYYRVSIDRCYALVGVVRTHWRGLSGSSEAWAAIRNFFHVLNNEGDNSAVGAVHA